MCYPKPGPRCFAHASQELARAEQRLTDATEQLDHATDDERATGQLQQVVSEALARRNHALHHVKMTPTGMKKLTNRAHALREQGHAAQAEMLDSEVEQLATERNLSLEAYRATWKEPGSGARRSRQGGLANTERETAYETNDHADAFTDDNGWTEYQQETTTELTDWAEQYDAQPESSATLGSDILVNILTPSGAHDAPTLTIGSHGIDVEMFSCRLANHHPTVQGCVKSDEHSSTYTEEIADKVKNFQRQHGLPVTGNMSTEEWEKLAELGVPWHRTRWMIDVYGLHVILKGIGKKENHE